MDTEKIMTTLNLGKRYVQRIHVHVCICHEMHCLETIYRNHVNNTHEYLGQTR